MYKNQRGEVLFFVALTLGVISGIAGLMGFGNDPEKIKEAEFKRNIHNRDVMLNAVNTCPGYPMDEFIKKVRVAMDYETKHWIIGELTRRGCAAPIEISRHVEYKRHVVTLPDGIEEVGGFTGIDPNPSATSAIMQGLGIR